MMCRLTTSFSSSQSLTILVAVIITLSSTQACFIRNCPKGGKRSLDQTVLPKREVRKENPVSFYCVCTKIVFEKVFFLSFLRRMCGLFCFSSLTTQVLFLSNNENKKMLFLVVILGKTCHFMLVILGKTCHFMLVILGKTCHFMLVVFLCC